MPKQLIYDLLAELRRKVSDISLNIIWWHTAKDYFGKSASWLHSKMNGIDGNGGERGFTPAELEQLKGALYDLSNRIRKVADTI